MFYNPDAPGRQDAEGLNLGGHPQQLAAAADAAKDGGALGQGG